ncbi:unnamed protein product [Leptidea sinapis]|uniref:Uncharacterized protein n=1 Tax=Leptidea sinapis TaxID=189913 RepID=A0A5E4QIY2_9NEOP|nr:unnamed protein product [Leptidea sinapis]
MQWPIISDASASMRSGDYELNGLNRKFHKGLRATLAEKEVTTLKEQLATTSPTPLQATVPPKTNGSHIESLREKVTDTRISERYSPDIKEEKRRTPDIDEDIEQKIEMAATARSNSNSSRSSPVVHQGSNLESELAAKEKEMLLMPLMADDWLIGLRVSMI